MKKIIIIGAGGNSKVVIDIVQSRIALGEELEVIGILDDDESKKSLKTYPVIGPVSMIKELLNDKMVYLVNGVGDNLIRRNIFEMSSNGQFYTAIHPSAIIGSGVMIEPGCIIMPGAIINADCFIGKQALINTGAIIEHDNKIGAFSHIASGTVTAGNVKVGECSMIGSGTRVIQGISIGKNVMIGAGSVVIRDVGDNMTVVGVPAKMIKSSNDNGEEI